MVYIFVTSLFVAVACIYENKWPREQFYSPPPKKSLKKPHQKCAKCYMKAPIWQAFLKKSLFKYTLVKDTWKPPNEKSAPNGRIRCFCEITFKCPIN